MHIKVFDKFSLGNLIEKRKKDKPEDGDEPAVELTEIGAETNHGAKDREKAVKKSNHPASEEAIALLSDVPPVRPHGPAAELTLEAEDLQTGDHITLDDVDPDKLAGQEEEVKISEVSAAIAAAAPQGAPATAAAPALEKNEEKKDEKADDAASLNALFNMDEEEENPLASLINSLPDVTARELIDDLAEIQRIIKEWGPISKSM